MKFDAKLVVVILTFNSAKIIERTIGAARSLGGEFYVVDSGSTDGTVELLQSMGCTVVYRPFTNYADQRNWAIAQVGSFEWQLHLDADEILDQLAVASILQAIDTQKYGAYMLKRRDYFMGQALRHSGLNPWHLRLFRSGLGQCEERLYDQHFVSQTLAGRLSGFMDDVNSLTLSEWVSRHNRWSDLEVAELRRGRAGDGDGVLRARLFGDPRERTRFLKRLYYSLPAAGRVVAYFTYRYFFRLGFLDGRVGFYYAIMQALWFRVLVDAKLYEAIVVCRKSSIESE